jgi:signal transduction histidine kinase
MQGKTLSWEILVRVALLAATTAAFGLGFWRPLRSEERSHAQRVTQVLARSVQTDIADEVRDQMHALFRFASLFSIKKTLDRGDLESQAQSLMRDYPGFVAVQWVDATYRVRWMATRARDEVVQTAAAEPDATLRLVLEQLANRPEAEFEFTSTFRLSNGDSGRRIVVPIDHQRSLGFVIATVDEPRALASILSDHFNLDYAIAVFENDEEIYRVPGSSLENEREWAQDAEVQLPGAGAVWKVRVWPEPRMLRDLGMDLSKGALLMGSMIGMLLFLTLDFARISYTRLKELRQARDELESRVHERTAELRISNQALGAEINERREAQESLQELSGHLLRLRDEEQRKIARELHDSTVQIMAALAIDIEKLQQVVPEGNSLKVQKLLADSSELVERATTELRTISYLLHPPILDDLGLDGALPWYAAGFSSRSGIQVTVDVQPGGGRLPRELELTLFRVVQEGLTNVHRHSGSLTVDVKVVRDAQGVTLQISDYGHGMPHEIVELIQTGRAVIGVGIAGMRERIRQLGGRLEIESGKKGTILRATLPWEGVESVGHADSNGADNPLTSAGQDTKIRKP